MRKSGFVVLLFVVMPAWAAAQGLGDAAARERQKRQQETKAVPARVFTQDDLPKDGAPAEGKAASADTEAGQPADPDPKAAARPGAASDASEASPAPSDEGDPRLLELERERQERKLQEAEWRLRFANAREQLALAEAACWHEVVRTQFYQGIPVQMKVKEFVESEEFRQAKQALADLEEQFRRTGLPPGWTRP
jgi:hypothetical protein